jgi:hypothetical protein
LHTLDRARDQGFGYAQGDHGNTVGVVDVPAGIFVLIVERDVSFVFLRSGLLEHLNDAAKYQRISEMAMAAIT